MDKSTLVRVVARLGQDRQWAARPDPGRTLPGRGAHLHPDPECLEKAVRRHAFARALRVQGPVDTSAVAGWLSELQNRGS